MEIRVFFYGSAAVISIRRKKGPALRVTHFPFPLLILLLLSS